MALIVIHHAMAAVVDNCQRLLVGSRVFRDSTLVAVEYLLDSGYAEVGLHDDIEVGIEAVSFNVFAEDFHVLKYFGKVSEPFFFGITVLSYSHVADGRVVEVAKDEALTFVRGEVG